MAIEGFFHGSTHTGLYVLDPIKSDRNNPFGPAVYLTKDLDVAECYSRGIGAIYEVAALGDLESAVNLDLPFADQLLPAKQALSKYFSRQLRGVAEQSPAPIRYVVHPPDADKAEINGALAESGVWMIYGHLAGNEVSGKMDRGVQYAVLDQSKLEIVGTRAVV